MPTTQQITATPRNAAGDTLTGRTITWASLNPSVATVSNTGLVTSVTPGTATVTASTGGITSNVNVTVNPAQASLFAFQPIQATINLQRSNEIVFPVTLSRANFNGDIVVTPTTNGTTGVTTTFGYSSTNITTTSLTMTQGNGTTFWVKLVANGSASLGTFAFGIEGNGTGGKYSNVAYQVIVGTAAVPSLAVTTTASTFTAARSSTFTVTANMVRGGGYTGDVTPTLTGFPTYFVSNLPVMITASASDALLTGSESQTVFTVNVPFNYPQGTYNAFVFLSGSGVDTAGATITVTVT
jgi:hypothetical protein